MIANDHWIYVNSQMLTPFEAKQVTNHGIVPVLSYGLSGHGYDIRLSAKDFRIFKHIPGNVIDPKNFNPENLEQAPCYSTLRGNSASPLLRIRGICRIH